MDNPITHRNEQGRQENECAWRQQAVQKAVGWEPPPSDHTELTSGLYLTDISHQRRFSVSSCSRGARSWHLADENRNSPDEVSVKTASVWPPTDCMVNGCSRGADTVLSSKPSITVSSSFKVKDTCGERHPQLIFSGPFLTFLSKKQFNSPCTHEVTSLFLTVLNIQYVYSY